MTSGFAHEIISKNRHPVGWVSIDFVDGVMDIPIQHAILHLPIWEIYHRFGIPVQQKHYTHITHSFSKDSFIKVLTQIYLELCIYENLITKDEFLWAAWDCINVVDNFGIAELAEYHCSISLPDLVEIIKDPALTDVINVDLDTTYGTDVVEGRLAAAKSKLCKLLGTPGALKNETLLPFQQAGILNSNQIPQVMISFGLRTEPNDVIIPRPVVGSSLSGMQDAQDLAIEQQAARKSAIMNHEAIRTSQYWGRKEHLVASTLAKVHPGCCGTLITIPILITASNYKNFIGKYIQNSDTSLTCLTARNIKQYIDTEVNLRNSMCCRHTDGVCVTCGGLVTTHLEPGMNLGINSAATLVSVVSQMILSTKHLIKTLSKIYQLPTQALDVFQKTITNGIYLQEIIRKQADAWYFGFYHEDFYISQTDLLELTESTNSPEERCTSIRSVLIKMPDGKMYEIPLSVDEQKPFLTLEFLTYMKDHYKDLTNDESVVWIPMQGIPKLPIFRTSIINDSMYAYVKGIIKFLESGPLTKYKSCEAALKHFCDLVWSKVPDIDIGHLEIILKAHMIVGGTNWDIPVVSDPDAVRFGKTMDVIMNRTYSGAFALQGHKKLFSSPLTYTVPRSTGTFDGYFDLIPK